jgi:hypothetical protein
MRSGSPVTPTCPALGQDAVQSIHNVVSQLDFQLDPSCTHGFLVRAKFGVKPMADSTKSHGVCLFLWVLSMISKQTVDDPVLGGVGL